MSRKVDISLTLVEALTGYADWLAELKSRIHTAQQRAALAVNRELMLLTRPGDYASRLRSYELPAREFESQ